MQKENANEEMSLSKQRKINRKKEIAAGKREAVLAKVGLVFAILLVIGVIVFFVVKNKIGNDKKVEVNSNYSEQLEDNGMIKGVKASDHVTIPDYNNITAKLSDLEYSGDDIAKDIQKLCEDNLYLDNSTELKAAEGDNVSLNYTGTIDGVEFEGGKADNSKVKLGSGRLVDDFEKQIEGHSPGDSFNVEVTFPEDYPNDTTLAGKDAVFAVTLNGIYKVPEFTDEFVSEKLSEYGSTTDDYVQYLKDTHYKENLRNFVEKYVVENTAITSYPSDYLKQVKGNYKANEVSYYEYMNQMYSTYYGAAMYESFDDYLSKTYSKTEEEYDATLGESVDQNMKYTLFCQAVAEKEGISVTLDEAREYNIAQGETEDTFNAQVTNYGQGYVVQRYLCDKVINMICDRVTVS